MDKLRGMLSPAKATRQNVKRGAKNRITRASAALRENACIATTPPLIQNKTRYEFYNIYFNLVGKLDMINTSVAAD